MTFWKFDLADNVASEVKSNRLIIGIVVEEFEFIVKAGFEVWVNALIGPILYSWGSEATGVSALFLEQFLNVMLMPVCFHLKTIFINFQYYLPSIVEWRVIRGQRNRWFCELNFK